VPEAEVEQKPKRAKAAPVARRTGTVTKAPAPETPPPAPPAAAKPAAPGPETKPISSPGVFGAYADRAAEGETRSRTTIFAVVAAVVLVLGAGAYWLTTRKSAPPPAPAAVPTAVPPTSVPVLTPTAAPAVDPKKVEEEVQRQMAQKKKEMQKALEAERKQKEPAPAAAAESAPTAAPLPEPTAVPAPPTEAPAAAEPTPEPTEPPPPTAAALRAAPAAEPELKRGDLVGPGPGVVEPALVSQLNVNYPPLARQQRISGRVVVLVLVDEEGRVAEAKLQQGVAGKGGVNEAVVDAVRRAKYRAASKNGVPVKMWRPVVVDVKP
jgi:TonB family protein